MSQTIEIARAQQRALRLYPRSKGFRSTYLKGVRARLAGRPIDACPYRRDPGKTWRQAYRLAWIRGWESIGEPGIPDDQTF